MSVAVIPQAPQRLLGNALAVRLTIVNDRDILITPALGQVVTTMIAWSVSRPHTETRGRVPVRSASGCSEYGEIMRIPASA